MTLKVVDLNCTNIIYYSFQSWKSKPKEMSILHKKYINNLYLLCRDSFIM